MDPIGHDDKPAVPDVDLGTRRLGDLFEDVARAAGTLSVQSISLT